MRWMVAVAAILLLGACTEREQGTAASRTAAPTSGTSTTVEPTTAPPTTTVAATAAPTTAPPTTSRPRVTRPDPATVVRRFYAAINQRDYRTAWALGGRNLGNRSYQAFVVGFGDTDHDDLHVTGVRGQFVDVRLVATQNGGSRETVYAGTYRVVGGVIVDGHLRVVEQRGGGSAGDCDPAYPDFCIPPPPPDLDCSDIGVDGFTALPPDPHHFDRDRDGLACESTR